jgi:hypothetical protein
MVTVGIARGVGDVTIFPVFPARSTGSSELATITRIPNNLMIPHSCLESVVDIRGQFTAAAPDSPISRRRMKRAETGWLPTQPNTFARILTGSAREPGVESGISFHFHPLESL